MKRLPVITPNLLDRAIAAVAPRFAVKRQQALIAGGKLDKSWQSIKPGTPEQVDGQKGKEWKVTFKDPAAADKSKANLYMFFTPQGNFIAANFTGN